MHTRGRKILKGDNDPDNLHHQLNSDFEVYLYLNDQQSQHNSTAYTKLLNSLILNRREKNNKLQKLKSSHGYQLPLRKSVDHSEFKEMEEKTGKEEEVKNTLERQITEIKKSLNLLKGDIGHLVLRNESAQLLGSKVNKAKIVAEDQLKRVTLALAKDRQEIKLRNQMQKKFNKKLKNLSAYETGGLTRVKNNYIEGQLKRDDVYKKLMSSQKAAQNGQEMAYVMTVKEKLDAQNLFQQQCLLQLGLIANHFSLEDKELPLSVESLHEQISRFQQSLNLSDNPTSEQVQYAVELILMQYDNLKESIKTMSEFFQEQLRVKQQLMAKMKECEKEERELLNKFQEEIFQSYKISKKDLECFEIKLKRFTSTIKAYFAILTYLQKQVKEEAESDKIRESFHQDNKECSYITRLHQLHQFLITTEPQSLTENCVIPSQEELGNFYDLMLYDIRQWLKEVKKKISESKFSCSFHRKTSSNKTNYRVTQILEPRMSGIVQEDNDAAQPHESVAEVSAPKEEEEIGKAKRIKLLEDIDSSYYKMIKATMKMQKENTRKNYEFLRTFKRAKYASRDQILEEKRFQASFSVLVTTKTSPSHAHSLKSTGFRTEHASTIRPFKTTYASVHANFRRKQVPKQQTAAPILKKVRSSIFEDKDRRIRLTQKLKMALEYS